MSGNLPTVWLLLDDKASHRSQILGVAGQLGWPAEEKKIQYNGFAALANGVFGARRWHLTRESRKSLRAPWPDLVIAAGRRAAPVALAIKKHSPATRLVHLMWPDVSPTRFDLIAVPEHDGLSYNGPNLLRTFGAPHAVTRELIAREAAEWKGPGSRLPKPHIAVLIGGSGKNTRYETADFKTLASYASAEAERLGGSLLITTSPRTDRGAEIVIKSMLTAPNIFHGFREGGGNPYAAFLGLASAIIVTGDSVSMCSEACATHKPVYIFTPPHLKKDKGGFREALFARGFAKPHTFPVRLDWQPALIPDAAGQVAEAIRKLLIHEVIAA